MIATPAAEVPGLRHNSFTTITAHAATKTAGAIGWPTRETASTHAARAAASGTLRPGARTSSAT
jgi:hypothetical protein